MKNDTDDKASPKPVQEQKEKIAAEEPKSDTCPTCGTKGGNGYILMYGIFRDCPTCKTIQSQL